MSKIHDDDYLPYTAMSPYRPVMPLVPISDGMRLMLKLRAIADRERAEGWLVGWEYTWPLDGSGHGVPRGLVAGER